MRDHETRFYACVARQKCRQPFALIRIHQSIDAALADTHEIGERNRGVIERERERRTVKISTGDDVAAVSKHEWIIGRRRGFDRQNLFAMSDNVAARTVHLRHATHAVGVLDTRIIFAMRFSNLALLSKRVQMSSTRFVSGMRPRFLQTWIDRSWR